MQVPLEQYIEWTLGSIFGDAIVVHNQIPHSFKEGDNAVVRASVRADPKEDGIEEVCKVVLTKLFIRDAVSYPDSKLALRNNNWKTAIPDLLQEVGTLVTGQPMAPADPIRPLPIPPSQSARAEKLYEAPVDKAARVRDTLCLVREIVGNEDGNAKLSHLKFFRGKPAWQHIGKLVEPTGLLPFLKMHCAAGEFEWDADGDKLYPIRRSVGLHVAPPPDIGQPVAPPLAVNDTACNSWSCISTPMQPVAHGLNNIAPVSDTSPGQPVAQLTVPNPEVCRCGECEAAWLEAGWACTKLK